MQAFAICVMLIASVSSIQVRNGAKDPCAGVECPNIQCQPPFELKTAEAAGSCCAVCWTDSVKSPEDRSWTKDLTGGIGANANGPVSCKGVVCLPLTCPETEQGYEEGRCCTTCTR
eukprot:gnl/MRDRNA2_/MRDRNA2_29205_c0_seq1.p1 gnl/MRDRNA2_/MRDRNA2_29205_c0~~gnl/MRDRNA2_/MRDRNA2_29205_c0_seq1.p1  ORF type:complete len:116 (-),score=20.14 gnl/MRDRNA2_/MRDRNA2_29205_c0_seq1:40-387(-)